MKQRESILKRKKILNQTQKPEKLGFKSKSYFGVISNAITCMRSEYFLAVNAKPYIITPQITPHYTRETTQIQIQTKTEDKKLTQIQHTGYRHRHRQTKDDGKF